ncbi:hypothetical protein CBS101457_004366 [Exobasidium rhododendri]|nr:hypothetical protein CBS101457_004366 [Exobasidium rhododendri]
MLHSPLSLTLESQTTAKAHKRSRQASTTGKTHFRIAPTLLETGTLDSAHVSTSSQYYDEQWKQWMSRSPLVGSTGSKIIASATTAPPLASSKSSYDIGWQKWMLDHRPDNTTTALFEDVPRAATLPIMSRLPIETNEHDSVAAEPTKVGSLDYLFAGEEDVGGVHPDRNVASTSDLKYTRARLPDLDDDSYQLWLSLHSLRSLSDDYAEGYEVQKAKRNSQTGSGRAGVAPPHPISADMNESQCPAFAESTSQSSQDTLALLKRLFNWDELPPLSEDVEHTWYGVAFRSKRRVGSESVNFYEDDRLSHEEAVNSGGLLMYWYGSPSEKTGHNLATCIWTSRSDALKASSLPLHARAAVHARKAYESFELSRYAIRKVPGETRLRLEEWME